MQNQSEIESQVVNWLIKLNGKSLASLEATQKEAFEIVRFLESFTGYKLSISRIRGVTASQSDMRIERVLFEAILDVPQDAYPAHVEQLTVLVRGED